MPLLSGLAACALPEIANGNNRNAKKYWCIAPLIIGNSALVIFNATRKPADVVHPVSARIGIKVNRVLLSEMAAPLQAGACSNFYRSGKRSRIHFGYIYRMPGGMKAVLSRRNSRRIVPQSSLLIGAAVGLRDVRGIPAA